MDAVCVMREHRSMVTVTFQRPSYDGGAAVLVVVGDVRVGAVGLLVGSSKIEQPAAAAAALRMAMARRCMGAS
jgi:uncharacterized protein YcfJ